MLNFKTSKLSDDQVLTTVYEAVHSRPGRTGTTLKLDVQVETLLRFGKTRARVLLAPDLDDATPEQVLDKIADWAERLAIAIRHRGPASAAIPFFADPAHPAEPEESGDREDEVPAE